MNVIMVSHKKGGVGKTTVSLNMAAALNKIGARAAVLDLDQSTGSAGLAYSQSVNLGAESDTSMPLVRPLVDMSKVEEVRATGMLKKILLRQKIDFLLKDHQVVVIDAGAGDPEENTFAVEMCDLLLIPFPCDAGDIAASVQHISIAAQFAHHMGRPMVRTLVNKHYPGRSATEQVMMLTTGDDWPAKRLEATIPWRTGIPEQALMGKTIFDAKGHNDSKESFVAVAREVIEILGLRVAP